MSATSPAPWTVNNSGGAMTIVARDRSVVAVVMGSGAAAPFESSNADLMAAAPDLRHALRDAVNRCAMLRGDVPASHKCPTCEDWREALAKADGLPPRPPRRARPRCPSCGDFAIDGKVTCGRVECGSSTGADR